MPPPVWLESPPSYASVVAKYETVLFDMDGVIWTGPGGDTLTPHIRETLQHLRAEGKELAFVTNK